MTQFDIITTLKTFAESLGWVFIWRYDDFYANIGATNDYDTGQMVLVADLRPTPRTANGKILQIEYTGLVMLGRKVDNDGIMASLDETQMQKYDRRLFELMTELTTQMLFFSCDNDLLIEFGRIDYLFNEFDANIDFVACSNIRFTQ